MADINQGDNPAVRHEERDVNALAVTSAGLAIMGLVVVVVFAMWFVFNGLAKREAALSPPLVTVPKLPPEPRLQATPVLDYKAMRAAEDEIMNGYGWIDPDHGKVRIPVNRALDVLAQKGMPNWGVVPRSADVTGGALVPPAAAQPRPRE